MAHQEFASSKCCPSHGPPLSPDDQAVLQFFQDVVNHRTPVALEVHERPQLLPPQMDPLLAPDMCVLGVSSRDASICVKGLPHVLGRVLWNEDIEKVVHGPWLQLIVKPRIRNLKDIGSYKGTRLRGDLKCVVCLSARMLQCRNCPVHSHSAPQVA